MKVISTTSTIVTYCEEMTEGKIVVNNDYQRSNKVWPAKARSYLIDTIIHGFPVPKLSLYQTTDLKSRKTLKEIVDGQQRSRAILDFANDKFRISGNSEFTGNLFSQLDDLHKQAFLEYQLSLDIFIGATASEIRQVFRRINSYNVPLNAQELRHATYQGDFKWFMVTAVDQYAQVLKQVGTFTESQLSRMKDASLLTEIIMATEEGVVSSSEGHLNKYYKANDDSFGRGDLIKPLLDESFDKLIKWDSLHNTNIIKPYNLYSFITALLHCMHPFESLQDLYPLKAPVTIDEYGALIRLSELGEALAEPEQASDKFADFIKASSEATNRIKQRKVRFKHFCDALSSSQ